MSDCTGCVRDGLSEKDFELLCDVKGWPVVNCAGCGKAVSARAKGARKLEGRIRERPYCGACLAPERRRGT